MQLDDITLDGSRPPRYVKAPTRSETKISECHQAIRYTFQGPAERDKFMRTFCDPMPQTHELHYEYEGPDKLALVIYPRLKRVTAAALVGEAVLQNLGVKEAGADEPAPQTPAPTPPAAEAHIGPDLDAERVRLSGLSLAELRTMAAERELTLDRSWGKTKIVAELLTTGVTK